MLKRGKTLEIFIAKSAGFCFGVKRALNIATDCADHEDGKIHTLGPIIHNPQVVQKLEETSNIHPKKTVDEMDGGTIIIRSHGVKLGDMDNGHGGQDHPVLREA